MSQRNRRNRKAGGYDAAKQKNAGDHKRKTAELKVAIASLVISIIAALLAVVQAATGLVSVIEPDPSPPPTVTVSVLPITVTVWPFDSKHWD